MPIYSSDGKEYENEFLFQMGLDTGKGTYNPDTDTFDIKEQGTKPQSQPAEPTNLHVFRHGDIDLETNHGWSPSSLNDQGVEQAHQAGKDASGMNFDAFHTSDLPRAQQTADIIGNHIGLTANPDPRFRTWDLGAYTGKVDQESKDAVKRLCTEALNESPPSSPQYQGESFSAFRDRITGAVGDLVSQNPGKDVGLVAHNSVEKVIRGHEANDFSPNGQIDMKEFAKENVKPGQHETFKVPAPSIEDIARRHQQEGQKIKDTAMDVLKHPADYIQPGPSELGMFGGVGSFLGRTTEAVTGHIDRYFKALEMGEAKKSAQEIFKKTGWYEDADGNMKFWVGPGARIKTENLTKDSSKGFDTYHFNQSSYKLSDVLEHPTLYQHYPELANIPIAQNIGGQGRASYNPGTKSITIKSGMTEDAWLEALTHEVQHGIQQIEGFPQGASPRMFAPKNLDDIAQLIASGEKEGKYTRDELTKFKQDYIDIYDKMLDLYYRTSGEVESRTASLFNQPGRLGNVTPREAAARDIPEKKRIRSEDFDPNKNYDQLSTTFRGGRYPESSPDNPYGRLSKPEVINAIQELKRQKRSIPEIADILNLSESSIEKYITTHGLAGKAQTKYPTTMPVKERRRLYATGYTAGMRGKELNKWLTDQFLEPEK